MVNIHLLEKKGYSLGTTDTENTSFDWANLISSVVGAGTSIVTSTQARKTALQTQETSLEIARLQKESSDAQLRASALNSGNIPPPNNTLLYASIAGGVLVMGLLGYMAFR